MDATFVAVGLDSHAAVARHAEAIALETSDYVLTAVRSGREALGRLAAATSFEKAAEIQSDYLRQSYSGFVAEATRLGALYADLAKDAYRPFEAIIVRRK